MPFCFSVMPRTFPPLSATLLVLVFAACTDPVDPASGKAAARKWDLEPRWTSGERYSVREELVQFNGSGPFPGTAEIESRAESVDRSIDIYDVTVVRAAGSQLSAVERTYRNSVHTVDGKLQPTVVSGRKYLIDNPFGQISVARIDGEGEKAKLLPEEQKLVGMSGLRIAASLVPGQPVPEGVAWKPGRSLEALAIRGASGTQMFARLDRVEDENGRRVAVVMAETDSRVQVQRGIESSLAIRETLRIDLDRARFESYRSVTDWLHPAYQGNPQKWRRRVVTVTVTGE